MSSRVEQLNAELWDQPAQVQIVALPFPSCINLGKHLTPLASISSGMSPTRKGKQWTDRLMSARLMRSVQSLLAVALVYPLTQSRLLRERQDARLSSKGT